MLADMKIRVGGPDMETIELPEDAQLQVTWPGKPGKVIRLRALALVMGEEDGPWFEVERRMSGL